MMLARGGRDDDYALDSFLGIFTIINCCGGGGGDDDGGGNESNVETNCLACDSSPMNCG
ncbi:MAG: hypothetical protein KC591_14825 [Gemmatimonadetes bacterium]|nr:hypothetical protein [Gemmatimonadota bacterium]